MRGIIDKKPPCTVERLNELFYYKNGKLFAKIGIKKRRPNNEVGCLCPQGYRVVSINNKNWKTHRIVWALHYGEWPKKQLDHINGNKSDNNIKNLREVSDSENSQNLKKHREGQPIGVFKSEYGKWCAQAPRCFLDRKEKKQKYIGTFLTQKEAAQAVIDFCSKVKP